MTDLDEILRGVCAILLFYFEYPMSGVKMTDEESGEVDIEVL